MSKFPLYIFAVHTILTLLFQIFYFSGPKSEICLSNTFWTKIPKRSHRGTVNCTVNGQYFAFELLELTQDCIFKADNPQRTILTGKVRIDATGNFLFNLLQKREKNSEDQIVGHFS